MTELFEEPFSQTFSDAAVDGIYALYPRKENKKAGTKRIREALARICAGEIDGDPRTAAEAIEYLREKTEETRHQMAGRERNFIPHPSTWYHQRRYLQSGVRPVAVPVRLNDCIEILTEYPKMPSARHIADNVEGFMPALRAIDKALSLWEEKGIPAVNCARRLRSRTQIYAMAVKEWPVTDLQYVPSPKRWFEEARYNHDESTWRRKPTNNFEAERNQLRNLIQ